MAYCYQQGSELTVARALNLEWLETNGSGGYASSTILGCNTRKYHGLLVSKLPQLPNKYVLLNQVVDQLIYNGQEYFLSAQQYVDCLQVASFPNLIEFIQTTHPQIIYQFGELKLTKEILLIHGEDTVLIKYKFVGVGHPIIKFRPLLAGRDFHQLQHENTAIQPKLAKYQNGFSCGSYELMPTLFFQTDNAFELVAQAYWYRNFLYQQELDRGYPGCEDLYAPAVMSLVFSAEREIIVACSTTKQQQSLQAKWEQEINRRNKNVAIFFGTVLQRKLQVAAQTFIEKTPGKNAFNIVAGYPWFLAWGRDAMIALPGLTLFSGKEELCLAVLKNFAKQMRQGLIPNFMGVTPEQNAYNSVDASLWFGWTVQQCYLQTKNPRLIVAEFWPVLKEIFHYYKNGTLHQIKMTATGLIAAGNHHINLTWMDAMFDSKPVTPRFGLQVEINALWFNLLNFMLEIASQIHDPLRVELQELILLCGKTFREVFWCAELGYLYDYVNHTEKNSDLRPNQIFAVSLPYSPLTQEMATSVVMQVQNNLLTPYGLRTLAPNSAQYIGKYFGSQEQRDLAYHNGTVWPWLLAHFAEALLKITADKSKVIAILAPSIYALEQHLAEYGIGGIAEVFSGDAPHRPNGCITQAWSVGEFLRLAYILQI